MEKITLTEYKRFDKIVSENEPEFLEIRLNSFGLKDYKDWFYGTNPEHIRLALSKGYF